MNTGLQGPTFDLELMTYNMNTGPQGSTFDLGLL